MNSKYKAGTIVIVFLLGVVVTNLFYRLENSKNHQKRKDHSTLSGIFFLGIVVTFDSEIDKINFLIIFKPYAEWVKWNEPTTLAFEISQSDKNPLQMFITERYVSKGAYLEVHRASAEFIAFKEKLVELRGYKLEGHSYEDLNIGFT